MSYAVPARLDRRKPDPTTIDTFRNLDWEKLLSRKSAPVRFGSIKPKPPIVGDGQSVGLLGGSFNPPHSAHRLITGTARRRLGLNAVWWVVTPGNPLKSHGELAPLDERLALCRQQAPNPKIKITAFEQHLPSAYTAATLAYLKQRYPTVNFVWLMGADNLATFHRWQDWRDIAQLMPIAVVDRPGWRLPSLAAQAAGFLSRYYVPEQQAKILAISETARLDFPDWPAVDTVFNGNPQLPQNECRCAGFAYIYRKLTVINPRSWHATEAVVAVLEMCDTV